MSTRYQGKAERPPGGPEPDRERGGTAASQRRCKKPRTLGSEFQTVQPAEAPCRPVWMLSLIAVALIVIGAALMAEALR